MVRATLKAYYPALAVAMLLCLVFFAGCGVKQAQVDFVQYKTLNGHIDYVDSVAFSPDGSTLATGSKDGTIRIWDSATGESKRILKGHMSRVRSVAFSPDGTTLTSASDDYTVKLWNVQTGSVIGTLKGHLAPVNCAVFSPDGRTVASAGDDRAVRLWDARTGKFERALQGHSAIVSAVAFSPDGKTLASGSYDNTVRLWDAGTGKLLRTLSDNSDMVYSVAFSPDGTSIVAGEASKVWDYPESGPARLRRHNKSVRVWATGSGKAREFACPDVDIWSVTFSPDGKLLACGCGDQTVRILDSAAGKTLQTLKGHTDTVSSVAFTHKGYMLASGSCDNSARLWCSSASLPKQVRGGKASTHLSTSRNNPKDGAEMVWVPTGEFIMGTSKKDLDEQLKITPKWCPDWLTNELPQHTVYLDGYWIYKTEVTVAQYRRFCDETHRTFPFNADFGWDDSHPIVNVTWKDAAAYAKWARAQLPTEAQWEKAARGTDGRIFPWGNSWDSDKCVNPDIPDLSSTMPAGSCKADVSPCGALDMAGNVSEWCADWYSADYYKHSPARNPAGPATGSYRVLRGGDWSGNSDSVFFRIAFRQNDTQDNCRPYWGFRCVSLLAGPR